MLHCLYRYLIGMVLIGLSTTFLLDVRKQSFLLFHLFSVCDDSPTSDNYINISSYTVWFGVIFLIISFLTHFHMFNVRYIGLLVGIRYTYLRYIGLLVGIRYTLCLSYADFCINDFSWLFIQYMVNVYYIFISWKRYSL